VNVFVPLVNACLAYAATKLGWLAQVVSLTPMWHLEVESLLLCD
jgi:cellobiose-specific phosphotransferase system component IIC